MNLCLTERAIETFDSNCKVSPPLRSEEDKSALIKAINTGSIEIISSNHIPLEEELKKKEFTYAVSGAIGLQTCFSGLMTYAENLKLEKIVNCLTVKSRKILGIAMPELEVGAEANLSLFDPEAEWTFDKKSNTSSSKNSPFWKQVLEKLTPEVIENSCSIAKENYRIEHHKATLSNLLKFSNRKASAKYLHEQAELFKTIASVSDKSIIVDSSKYANRAFLLIKGYGSYSYG